MTKFAGRKGLGLMALHRMSSSGILDKAWSSWTSCNSSLQLIHLGSPLDFLGGCSHQVLTNQHGTERSRSQQDQTGSAPRQSLALFRGLAFHHGVGRKHELPNQPAAVPSISLSRGRVPNLRISRGFHCLSCLGLRSQCYDL